MKVLPKKIQWISVNKISSNHYQEVLIATHKHSAEDWTIYFGWIQPINQYTDFKVMSKPCGLSSDYPDREIPKDKILSIGIFENYGYMK